MPPDRTGSIGHARIEGGEGKKRSLDDEQLEDDYLQHLSDVELQSAVADALSKSSDIISAPEDLTQGPCR
jgi:hypothetical protein